MLRLLYDMIFAIGTGRSAAWGIRCFSPVETRACPSPLVAKAQTSVTLKFGLNSLRRSTTAPLLAATAISLCLAEPAAAECGERGGPGYRGPNGKCVGWAEMGRICGTPPDTRCRAEAVAPNAAEAAGHGAKIEELRQQPRSAR